MTVFSNTSVAQNTCSTMEEKISSSINQWVNKDNIQHIQAWLPKITMGISKNPNQHKNFLRIPINIIWNNLTRETKSYSSKFACTSCNILISWCYQASWTLFIFLSWRSQALMGPLYLHLKVFGPHGLLAAFVVFYFFKKIRISLFWLAIRLTLPLNEGPHMHTHLAQTRVCQIDSFVFLWRHD